MASLPCIVDIGGEKHKHKISTNPVCLVHLVSLMQPNKRDKPNNGLPTGQEDRFWMDSAGFDRALAPSL